jgi:hypothetical protein
VTQAQLDRAVASATGETLRDVRSRGFGLLSARRRSPEPDQLILVIACPFCRAVVQFVPASEIEMPALVGCPECDVEFEYAPHEIRTVHPHSPGRSVIHGAT